MNATDINLNDWATVFAGVIIIGGIIKNAIPSIPNRFIPLITWVMGVVGYQLLVNGWDDSKQWLVAIITAASGTGAHSGTKNTFQKKEVQPSP